MESETRNKKREKNWNKDKIYFNNHEHSITTFQNMNLEHIRKTRDSVHEKKETNLRFKNKTSKQQQQ